MIRLETKKYQYDINKEAAKSLKIIKNMKQINAFLIFNNLK